MKIGGSGYTIIEVMIVLAISGALLIGAAAIIGGKQGTTQFQVSSRDFNDVLNSISNNISNGYFSTVKTWSCSVTTGSPPTVTPIQGGTTQGSNGQCMFIGQVVQLTPSSPNYTVTPLIGAQYKGGSASNGFSVTLSDSGAAAITQETATAPIGNGVTIGCVLYNTTSGADTITPLKSNRPCDVGGQYVASNAIVFLTTYQGSSVGGTYGNNRQINLLVAANTSTNALSTNSYIQNIDTTTGIPAAFVQNPPGGIYICLQSASSDQYALLEIGGANSQTTTQSSTIYTGSCS